MSLGARRIFVLSFVLFVVWAVTLGAARVQAGPVAAAGVVDASPDAAREARSQRRAREVPTSMVLCRGPRGTVYARDVKVGCRNAQLGPGNLVDFGAGEDCFLRQATVFDPEGEKTKGAKTCDDVCRAADEARGCIVALRRGPQEWGTFGPAEIFAAGANELLDATAVCCRR